MTVQGPPTVGVRDLVAAAERRLAAAGVASPRHDAEELAAHLAGVSRSVLHTVPVLDAAAYGALVERRAARVPLQHLTGIAGFRWLELEVGPGVFVPRPETESVVEWCLRTLAGTGRPLAADLCAGSGAIALALADEHPDVVVHAVEREPAAYAWLRRNVERLDATRVRIHLADAATALPDLDGSLDLVVSNPPYIPDGARPLDPEVRDHDPPTALWGGPDGLDVVRAVQATAARLLRPGGAFVVEHSDRHGSAVPDLLRAAGGWADVRDHRDLAGRPRFATARRAG